MLKIVQVPDPLLNKLSEECDFNDRSLRKLAKDMQKAMYANNGVGIAAPQVGVLKRLIVVDCSLEEEPDPLTLLNPRIIDQQGELIMSEEGCLSCPGISVPIARHPYVKVRYFDLDGEEWEIEGEGLLGRCLQHEIDHLDGKTLFESAAPKDRLKALTDYEEARKAGAKPGDTGIE